jgi:ParB family chromosome partitioning protein
LRLLKTLQREDLNPIDRARAFMRLHTEFGFTHAEIGKKMGKSREYVSNSLRLLALPQDIMMALARTKDFRRAYTTVDDVVRSTR